MRKEGRLRQWKLKKVKSEQNGGRKRDEEEEERKRVSLEWP